MFRVKYTHLILLFTVLILGSCNSVTHFNKKFDAKISPEKLQKDVTYIHNKLTKLHPQLYYYISKKDLDYKFDSLKHSLTEPLTQKEFFFKISPVISAIRQGHSKVYIPEKQLTKRQIKVIDSTSLLTPLSNLDVEFFKEKLFVVRNKSVDSSIQIGTEIISVDSISPLTIVNKYNKSFTSDGFIPTRNKSIFKENIFTLYYLEYGYKDSLQLKLCFKEDTVTKWVKRVVNKKRLDKNKQNDQRILKTKNCKLSFVGVDSNIAFLQVYNFHSFTYEKFFKKIDSVKSTKLIIDLRGNPGGLLYSSEKLFSHLIDTAYSFFQPFEVTSRTSVIHTRKFRGKNSVGKLLHIAFLPLNIVHFGIQLLRVKKVDNRYYSYPLLGQKTIKPRKKYTFKNQIYVITDGGTFSSACLLSSVLKGYKLAKFVGEETGGDFNGTCAGQMPTFTLPNSNLCVVFGLKYLKTNCTIDTFGRGIMPDVEIIPTLEDRINQRDPELEWILNDIKTQK